MTKYLTCAETAKIVRKALREAFPGQKFSVKSKVYSGGASITVYWTDGPTADEVEAITRQFSGAGFDGMIDLKYYITHWLLPDGSTVIARSSGTEGSGGGHPARQSDKPHPDAVRVSFGANYIFTSRDISAANLSQVATEVDAKYSGYSNCSVPTWNVKDGKYPEVRVDNLAPVIPGSYESFPQLVYQQARATSFYQGATNGR